MYVEVCLTAKLTKVETGEILWSAEILKTAEAQNVGGKRFLKLSIGNPKPIRGGSLLDEIITEMADSFKEKKNAMEKIKVW